jgi:hypothetical protein
MATSSKPRLTLPSLESVLLETALRRFSMRLAWIEVREKLSHAVAEESTRRPSLVEDLWDGGPPSTGLRPVEGEVAPKNLVKLAPSVFDAA